MRPSLALAACLLAASAAAAPSADDVANRFFSNGWAAADRSVAPAPPTPKAAALPELPEGPFQEEHGQVAHMSITRAGYLYYASRYEGGELGQYLGESKGKKPASDTPDNVVAGAYDEDSVGKNPWGYLIPELRHFWDCRKGPYKGLWGNDSSVDRAQKYFTGGFGLKGEYDHGWEKHEVKGHGLVWHYQHGDKALAYWYLGHAAHLLEDATVPAHVLLYPHPLKNVDRYETYMGTHYAEWESRIPEGEVASYDKLYDLFYHTANITNDYDAGSGGGLLGRNGKKDRGSRRAHGFTEAELRAEGDVLMPLAYRSVAAIYLYFYKQIDHVPPTVALVYPTSRDEAAPDLTFSSRVTLAASAKDDLSGVDRFGYQFEYEVRTNAGWSAWRLLAKGRSTYEFDVAPGASYKFRVSAVDAAGNRAYSPAAYLSAASGPAVASTR